MTIKLYNMDNMDFVCDKPIDLVYADMIYENLDLSWINKYWEFVSENGIFQVQTDYHSSAQVKLLLDDLSSHSGGEFINEVIMLQEWGGVPAKGFPIKHDNIFIYSKGKDWKWHGDRIQIPKVTAGTKLDKKGTGLKTPCSVFYDLGNFSTLSKERIKDPKTGKNIRWQKSLKLMRRLMYPFLDMGDLVCDPFMGTGTSGAIADELGCNYIGIEYDSVPFELAKTRLLGEQS